ncbi:MAG: SnoaL-like polyketide cyclase [Solirubrobacterales bacterium]|nr:SnoaL-like polyketide cyclase [Solirubrobacterales bacterium]
MSAATELVSRLQQVLSTGDLVAAMYDDEEWAQAEAALEPLVDPDFEIAMIGPSYTATELRDSGIEGFRRCWQEWTSPFESFEVEVEQVIDAGERVLTFVTQTGRTKTGGAEVSSHAAAVWTVHDGRVARVEFHLDRDVARRAAGLDG